MADQEEGKKALERLQALDRAHHLHPFTDPQALMQAPPFVMTAAEGCYVAGHGIRLLDAMAGLGCVNIGYGRQEMVDAAAEAMKSLSYYHAFAAISSPQAAALAGRIAALTPEGLNKVFFANSGSEANETLLKLARLYWRRKGRPEKKLIISRDYSYHGSTIATTLLNGNDNMLDDFGLSAEGRVLKAQAPFWYRHGGDMNPDEFGLVAARSVEEKILEAGPENVAAFFAEPIQGTMGAVVPPATYWPEVERICRKHEVLLVADEVVTGLGRTGHWFAQETFGFKADMMALAKGLSSGYIPISAAVISDEIAEVIEAESHMLSHGFTTSAHPTACAVALKNLEIIEREGLVARIKEDIGPYFKEGLESLLSHPMVGEVRASGLMAGVEIVRDKETKAHYPLEMGLCQHISHAMLARGVIARPVGNILVLCPPFIIKKKEVDYLVNVFEQALNTIHEALHKGVE